MYTHTYYACLRTCLCAVACMDMPIDGSVSLSTIGAIIGRLAHRPSSLTSAESDAGTVPPMELSWRDLRSQSARAAGACTSHASMYLCTDMRGCPRTDAYKETQAHTRTNGGT